MTENVRACKPILGNQRNPLDLCGRAFIDELASEIANKTDKTVKVQSLRVSCGCTVASMPTAVIPPGQSTVLTAQMDTRRFLGPKTVTIYLTVGPQFTSTATLKVSANARADVVFNPGQVNFGAVARGQTPTQMIDVEYAGALRWEVKEVVKSEAPYTVAVKELYRRPGQVGYRLSVTMKATAPVGTLKHDVYLKTNDPSSPLVAILVEAHVQLDFLPGDHAGLGMRRGLDDRLHIAAP